MTNVIVLRWGHRYRDKRLTSHVALTARALGASGFILADVRDKKVETTVEKVTKRWGGPFCFKMGTPWKQAVEEWKAKEGIIVHLTAYGENIQTTDVLERIEATGKDILVIVGSRKVPSEFFSEKVSDYNVAIGNQPHSECSSLAIFLYKILEGRGLLREFKNAKVKIIPQIRGKKTQKA